MKTLTNLSEEDKQRITERYQLKHSDFCQEITRLAADCRKSNDLVECVFLWEVCNAVFCDTAMKLAGHVHREHEGATLN